MPLFKVIGHCAVHLYYSGKQWRSKVWLAWPSWSTFCIHNWWHIDLWLRLSKKNYSNLLMMLFSKFHLIIFNVWPITFMFWGQRNWNPQKYCHEGAFRAFMMFKLSITNNIEYVSTCKCSLYSTHLDRWPVTHTHTHSDVE